MRPGTNRLLMLLISASLAGCASQTDRSSSGAGAQDATPEVQPAQTAAAPQPDYEPQREEVQYIDRPLEETPAPVTTAAPAPDPVPAPAPTRSAADEPLPDFPITKYEIEEAPAEEVEDLGTQPDESVSGPSLEEETVASASTIGEPTMEPDEPEVAEEVEDLGTQPDESGTVSYPEDQLAQKDDGIGEPTTYPDEPVQQAATPSSVSVSFEAEPLFSFDKAVIRNDQRKSLDEFVAGLQGVEYDEITAIGHADKLGSDAYNQKLSERRANAVKTYLVSRGVPAGKIRAEGRGESEPVTGDACKGTRGKALISCLQPDRRVDVSASGSKSN